MMQPVVTKLLTTVVKMFIESAVDAKLLKNNSRNLNCLRVASLSIITRCRKVKDRKRDYMIAT
jgi:hypothetical protein